VKAISVAFAIIAFAEAFDPIFHWVEESSSIPPLDKRLVSVPMVGGLTLLILRRGAKSKPMGQGTGLSLSVSLGIARQHGGDIRVHSREGEVATFSVILPALEHGAGEDSVPAAHA
jgi:hypothetical protein